jgi:lysozyme
MSRVRVAATSLAISGAVLVGIAVHEGYVGHTYLDPVGIPTIGFGETQGVKPGQTTTPTRALVQLLDSANSIAKGMVSCIHVPLYQHEYDAYLSFSYNVGSGAFCRSTLVKKLNAQDYEGACAELKKWVYAGGKVLPGLVTRREKEYKLCMGQ